MSDMIEDTDERSYKATFRFPTEQFAYIEIEAHGSPESLLAQHSEFQRLLKVGIGLEAKEWRPCLDGYLTGKGMNVECHEKMNSAQRWMIHEIDKSKARTRHPKKSDLV